MFEPVVSGHPISRSQEVTMKLQNYFAVLILAGAVAAPLNCVDAKEYKAGVTVSTVKKGGKRPTKAQLMTNPTFKDAIGSFQKKDYAEALKNFQVLDSTGFCSDTVHYYIAQCYQNTNQTVAAEQHYNWVLEKSKDVTLRRYAEYANQCLAYYSGHRTYNGQGNNFDRGSRGGFNGGGGGRVSFG
jgi:hypothetical protein